MSTRQGELFTVGAFGILPNGFTVKGTPPPEEWAQALSTIARVRDGVQWAIGDLLNYGETRKFDEDTYVQAMEATGLKRGTLQNLKSVAKAFTKSKRISGLSWSHHALVAGFPDEERDGLLGRAQREGLTWDEMRGIARSMRHQQRLQLQDFPTGTFGLFYVDPPWTYEEGAVDPSRDINNQYPTMPTDEICALAPRVQGIAAPNAILYMWATSAKMVSGEAVQVVNAWGFTGRSMQVWVKDMLGMGYWARQRHEHLIIAVRGTPVPPADNLRPDSVIQAARREHSRKPDSVYEQLERCYVEVPKIELFAREPRLGWTQWGNEEIYLREETPTRGVRLREDAPAVVGA